MPITNRIGFSSIPYTQYTASAKVNAVFAVAPTTENGIIPLGDRKIALQTLTSGFQAISVYQELSGGATTKTVNIGQRNFALKTSGHSYALVINNTGGSTVPTSNLVLQGVGLATNTNGDLILAGQTGTITEEDAIYIGDIGIRVVLIGGQWQLVVST